MLTLASFPLGASNKAARAFPLIMQFSSSVLRLDIETAPTNCPFPIRSAVEVIQRASEAEMVTGLQTYTTSLEKSLRNAQKMIKERDDVRRSYSLVCVGRRMFACFVCVCVCVSPVVSPMNAFSCLKSMVSTDQFG